MGRLATMLAVALACLLSLASGHVTFKLPATPGLPGVALYPNTAPSGGYGAHRLLHTHTQTRAYTYTRSQALTHAGARTRGGSARPEVLPCDHASIPPVP